MENENMTPNTEQLLQPEAQPVEPEQPHQSEQPVEPEQPKKRHSKGKRVAVAAAVVVLALAICAGVYFLFLHKGAEKDGSIVGTWYFDGGYVNDAYISEAAATLYISDDETARLVIDGKQTALTWSASKNADGTACFDVLAEDGTVCELQYFTDPADRYCGDLLLYRDDGNMLYFIR